MSSVFDPHHGADRDAHPRTTGFVGNDSLSSADTLSEEEMVDLARRERVARAAGEVNGEYDTATLEAGAGTNFYNSHVSNTAKLTGTGKGRPTRTKSTAGGKPPPRVVPLDKLMELTQAIQAQQDRQEQEDKMAAAVREAEERRIRNQRWLEVKARMTARSSASAAATARTADWNDSEDDYLEDDGYVYSGTGADRLSVRGRKHGAVVPMADDPLIDPEQGEERPMRRLVKREKLPWSVEFWHTAYNWFRWAILGMFYMRDLAEDPSGYYQKRKFD